MIGEHPDGSVIEIKSWDINFLEEEFLRRDVDRNLGFYEMDKPKKDSNSNFRNWERLSS